jgi:hypothetical protein
MNDVDPVMEEIGRRSRAAMQAEYAAHQPADGWAAIVERLDRRPSMWTWLAQHPLLVGAAAAVVALLVVLTVTLLTADEGEDLDMVDTPPADIPVEDTLVAVTTDGRLVELGTEGEQLGEIDGDFAGYLGGALVDPHLEIVRTERGDSVFAVGRGSALCPAGDLIETDLYAYPLYELGPTEDILKVAIPRVAAFSVSPDGDRVAVVTAETDDPCSGAYALALYDLTTGDVLEHAPLGESGAGAANGIAWLDDERIAYVASGSEDTSVGRIAIVAWADGRLVEEDRSQSAPLDGVIAGAGSGSLLVATADPGAYSSASSVPGAPEVDVSLVIPDESTVASIDYVDEETWGAGPVERLTPLSLAGAPGGSAYVVVTDQDGAIAEDGSIAIDDPDRVALFGTPPGGPIERVSDGVVAVALRPGSGSAPEPTTTDAPTTTGPTTTGPTTTTPTTTTTPPPPPPAFVYVTWRGEVFRQTIGGGTELVTTLAELPGLPLDGRHQVVTSHRLAPTPDGSTVYLSRPVSLDDGCQRMLYAVSLEDGAVTELGRGDTPAVSPDGTKLAYFDTHEELTEFAQGCPTELVVRDLETGAERRWRDVESYEPNAYGGFFDLQWAPDNRTVVVDHGYESSSVLTADTAAPEGDLSLSRLGIDQLPRYPDGPEFYSLVAVTQMAGVTAPVVSGWCYALPECPGTDVYYTVPVDGSPVESGSRSTLASVLLPGILFFGPCPVEEGADCYGAPLHYQPAAGAEQVLVPEHLVKAFAWLP